MSMLQGILVLRRKSNLHLFVAVRNGGGGGRPGGARVLNFKEKKILGLDKPYKRLTNKPFGFFDELEPFIDESRGDFIIPIGHLDYFEEPDTGDLNDKRKIDVKALFGSNKSSGILVERHKKKRFSHSRVFGHKMNKTEPLS